MIVEKFGGSILADAEGLSRVVARVRRSAEQGPAVAVVSALKGVTDQLFAAVDSALQDAPFELSLIHI